MPHLSKLLTLFGIFGMIAVSARLGGIHIGDLLQSTAFLGVGGLTLFASAHHLGWRDTWGGMASALLGVRPDWASSEGIENFRAHSPTWAMYAAHLVSILGLIHVMKTLDDPSQLGAGIAMAFIAYVYGALFVLLFGGVPSLERQKKALLSPASALVPGLMVMLLFMTVMYAISQPSAA